eukprot:COSAG01_NODE_1552_length_9933_cov_13.631483_6_plen_272_part_00
MQSGRPQHAGGGDLEQRHPAAAAGPAHAGSGGAARLRAPTYYWRHDPHRLSFPYISIHFILGSDHGDNILLYIRTFHHWLSFPYVFLHWILGSYHDDISIRTWAQVGLQLLSQGHHSTIWGVAAHPRECVTSTERFDRDLPTQRLFLSRNVETEPTPPDRLRFTYILRRRAPQHAGLPVYATAADDRTVRLWSLPADHGDDAERCACRPLLSRRGRSLPANASGLDTHRDSIPSRGTVRLPPAAAAALETNRSVGEYVVRCVGESQRPMRF